MSAPSEIILLAGLSCTGKSTIARELGKNLKLAVVENQPVMDALTVSSGFPRTRDWIKSIGISEFSQIVCGRLGEITKENGLPGTIIDGCLGFSMLGIFQNYLPQSVIKIVGIESDYQERVERMMCRLNTTSEQKAREELKFRDYFLGKTGLDQIFAQSLLGVVHNTNGNLPLVVEKIIDLLR